MTGEKKERMAWFKMKERDREEGRMREWAGEKKVE